MNSYFYYCFLGNQMLLMYHQLEASVTSGWWLLCCCWSMPLTSGPLYPTWPPSDWRIHAETKKLTQKDQGTIAGKKKHLMPVVHYSRRNKSLSKYTGVFSHKTCHYFKEPSWGKEMNRLDSQYLLMCSCRRSVELGLCCSECCILCLPRGFADWPRGYGNTLFLHKLLWYMLIH